MKIGIDCRLWSQSGVGRYIRNLVKELSLLDENNSYLLFCLSQDQEEVEKVIGKNFQIKIADVKWHSLKEQLIFKSLINREDLDLMHFPYFSLPILYKKPYIITIHDLIINHFSTGKASTLPLPIYRLKYLGYKYLIKKAAKNAEKIITVSNSTKQEIIDHFNIDKSKIIVTYEGVDGQIFNSSVKNIFENYFLYVGNAYPHKNLNTLIEAFTIFNKRHEDFKLVLAGPDDYFYKRLKQKIKNENIIFRGKVSDGELFSLYKNAKALIMPSLMEGFGLPVLEAFANKCLVLCSDIPVFREIAKNAAIYFDPNSPKDISDKMTLSMKGDYKKNIEEGYEFSKQFSWKKTAKETLKIYESSISLR